MKKTLTLQLLICLTFYSFAEDAVKATTEKGPKIKIARLVSVPAIRRSYPNGLTTLLDKMNKMTNMNFDAQPAIITSFENENLFKYPFLYINYIDRENWKLSLKERDNLKKYLERGGFIFIDAGINSSFLRKNKRHGQSHSFAEWKITPELKTEFENIFPRKEFEPLKNSHEIFKSFYQGLPDPKILPDSVRDYVINEKWPDGSYSTVALTVNNRIAVIATPIIGMGWGKDRLGQWITNISFRVRESEEGLSDSLKTASYSGERFEATRKDGRIDALYCQSDARPEWAEEADGNWRIFKYYTTKEISDYAHQYFTRLGVNIITYALSH